MKLICIIIPRMFDLDFLSLFYLIAMTNQELIDAGMKTMDETDQAIERTKKVNQTNQQFQASILSLLSLLALLTLDLYP